MPIFECSRCNVMTYSSSTTNAAPCPECGSQRRRLVSDAASFAEAREIPRGVSHGDHSIAVFDDVEQIVPLAVQFIDQALLAGGLVMAAVPQELEDAILAKMHPEDAVGIAWEPPTDMYGPAFDADANVARFREIAETEPRPVFVIGCPSIPMQDFTSVDAWIRYERLAHELAVDEGITVLCLYDARLHDDEMISAGLRTHALAGEDAEFRRNEAFDYDPPA
jgi:MEDS: MEthanogen/methylotroph, DcmR Sensory domain